MSPMRKKSAEHMIESRRTSAHVQSGFEVDRTRGVALRDERKTPYAERHGPRLTVLPFLLK